ncbi:phospholipase A2 inhibitor and Ly6/PLAUR domain-containing protein-like [Engystomops pustulosus]|uniref:phospholipase A2 inhibitor and Ly6/PLAUR domain-containing protein-like n=1 Tax=Engystomops pustulosus TaxID=76066 RepID=UPI003AFA94E0
MSVRLVILCILLLPLAATSFRLRCANCTSQSLACNHTFMSCPQGDVCGSDFSYDDLGRGYSLSVTRQCINPSVCNITSSESIQRTHSIRVFSCCYTDYCTPSTDRILQMINNTSPNGLVCPTCSSLLSNWCYTSETVQCKGEENMCFFLTIITKVVGRRAKAQVFRGCTIKSVCDQGNFTYEKGDTVHQETMVCNKAR